MRTQFFLAALVALAIAPLARADGLPFADAGSPAVVGEDDSGGRLVALPADRGTVVARIGSSVYASRFLRGAAPVLDGLHNFLQEFNPVLSYLNYDARAITAFLSNGAATANYRFPTDSGNIMHALAQYGILSTERNFGFGASPEQEGSRIPKIERANAYPLPENYITAGKWGIIQSFSCANIGGEKSSTEDKSPPCKVQGHSAWDNNLFPRLERGKAPNQKAPDDPGAHEAPQPNHYK